MPFLGRSVDLLLRRHGLVGLSQGDAAQVFILIVALGGVAV